LVLLYLGYEGGGRGFFWQGGEMPYDNLSDLPDSVRNNLPKHTQEIYRGVYNSAEDRYGEESRAHRVAWSAVEHKYENDQGNWVQKEG
jgi:cation transport regulator